MNSKRIAVELPLPSLSLKNFIRRILTDDEFFALALENPLGAMKEGGINLNTSDVVPSDFTTFFGALAGLKQVIKEKKIDEVTFEKVFGQVAVIRGAVIDAQLNRGFFRDWDNRDAFVEREQCFSTQQKFEALRERGALALKAVLQAVKLELRQEFKIDSQRSGVGQTFESADTDNHTKTDWSNPDDMQRNRGSDRGVNTKFESSGLPRPEDYLRGPLIHPVDLAAISARISSLAQVLKETAIK